ncbi:MAG: DUF1569 domain-containing protein [Saprospiraceae bacterium]
MENLFTQAGVSNMKMRIDALTPATQPQWGKMNVSQMLAHCCVAYEIEYTDKHPKPGAFGRFMIKLFAKSQVVGPKPYPKNGRTAPMFIIADEREFEVEKQRLLEFMDRTCELGPAYFDGKANQGFGVLTETEWNTMYSKHLDHHLTQFGV